MKKQEIQDGGVRGRTVVLLVFRYVNSYFFTGTRFEHIVLPRSVLVNESKIRRPGQQPAWLVCGTLSMPAKKFPAPIPVRIVTRLAYFSRDCPPGYHSSPNRNETDTHA
jgi:hypothetical protein